MKGPLVSIIIPVYNVSRYLRQCLDSVINQTYKNLEIILVDDGSTDDSGIICDEYVTDSRVRVLHQENKGQASARNEAIKISNGKYILYVDSDDYISNKHVEQLVQVSMKYDADIVQCTALKFLDRKQLIHTSNQSQAIEKEYVYNASAALKEFCYQKQITPSPWCKLIKRELMNGLEFPVGVGYEDMAVIYKMIGKAQKIVFLPEVSYYYRQHQGSTMHTMFSDKKVDRIRIAELFLSYIKEFYPENSIPVYTRYSLAQLQLLMELPFGKEYRSIRNTAYGNLKKSRVIMLHDREAPIRLKIMVGASYLGPVILMCLGRLYIKVTKR